jgi:hypothetical protein
VFGTNPWLWLLPVDTLSRSGHHFAPPSEQLLDDGAGAAHMSREELEMRSPSSASSSNGDV